MSLQLQQNTTLQGYFRDMKVNNTPELGNKFKNKTPQIMKIFACKLFWTLSQHTKNKLPGVTERNHGNFS